jgi:hypothetical protein
VTSSSVVKKEQIQEGISQRDEEIVKLNAQIRNLEIQQRQRCHEEEDRIRPTLDELHAQIIILQQQMALYWREHEARVMQSQGDTEMAILDIESKISALEKENNYALSLLAPIRRLPAEMLSEIFMLAITEYDCSALRLTHVCRSWRLVLLAMSRIWSNIKVGTWTSTEKIQCLLERRRRITLDVEIDTESDATAYTLDPCRCYTALIVLAGTSVHWRGLTIRSFPKEEKLLELEALGTSLTFDGPLESLESFKITGPCEMNTALGNLIDLTRKAEKSKLTTLELSSASALYRFAEASFGVFHFLRVFKVDLAEMKEPLDLLPHFQCLEDMYVHRLHLPLYSDTVHLPLTRTLKRLFLKSTSVQWMNNRTFPKLVECTIIWPHFPETLLGQSGVDLSSCTSFIYDDHLLQPLGAFKLSSVDKLVVRNEAWNRPRGGQQLGFIWGPNASIERILRPRILHLDTQCYDQHLITALKMIPHIEELILGLVRPDVLGKKFLLAMAAKRGKGSLHPTSNEVGEGTSGSDISPAWTASLCPNLRVFGLKYRRWLREHETDELTPLFRKIVETRSKSDTPLQSLKVWPTMDTTEQEAQELVD